MAFDLDAHRPTITTLLRQASHRSLAWYRQSVSGLNRAESVEIENKASAGFDPVTQADRIVEAELRQGLERLFPDHAILGEEFGESGNGASEYRWTIDPIDGTRAFIVGQPMWGTLLGLQHKGQPIAGWMHAPVLDETYYSTGMPDEAETAVVAAEMRFADGTISRLNTSSVTELADAIVACTHPDMFGPGDEADRFARLTEATRMTRYSGDCLNYALLAMGLVDLVVENKLAVYDIVPLIPIVQGAGATISGLDGQLPLDGGYVVAAATAELHARALEVLAPV